MPHPTRRECLATLAALPFAVSPAAAQTRYIVGCVKPLTKPPSGISDESNLELTKFLPANVTILPNYLNLTKGTQAEMKDSLVAYETHAGELAAQHANLVSIEGAPPFMVLGRMKETALISAWEKKYKTPMFTSSQNQVNAFKAIGAKKIYGVTPFSGVINENYANYFVSAGYNATAIDGVPGIAFTKIQDVNSNQVYEFIKANIRRHKNIDTVYILGSAWNTLDIIEPLEQEFGITVVHPVTARAWEIQRRLNFHYPVTGYGRLIATLPT